MSLRSAAESARTEGAWSGAAQVVEIYRIEFIGPEIQADDPAAELTLKLISKQFYKYSDC